MVTRRQARFGAGIRRATTLQRSISVLSPNIAKLRDVWEVQCPERARRLSPFDALTLAQGGLGVSTPGSPGLPWETRPDVTSLEGAPGSSGSGFLALRSLVGKRESRSRTRTIPEGLRGWLFFARFAICWYQSIDRVLMIALCSSPRISPSPILKSFSFRNRPRPRPRTRLPSALLLAFVFRGQRTTLREVQ